MFREDQSNAIIELGAVSVDTKGRPIGLVDDQEGTFKPATGLTDD